MNVKKKNEEKHIEQIQKWEKSVCSSVQCTVCYRFDFVI